MRDAYVRLDPRRLVFPVLALLLLLSSVGHAEGDDGKRLIMAIEQGDTGSVATLLSDGVSPDSRYGKDSAITRAALQGDVASLRLLYAHGARLDPDVALASAAEGQLQVMEELLGLGVPVETSDPYGMSLLMTAALHGHAELVALLLERGATVAVREVVNDFTPLIVAAAHGHPRIVRMLIAGGADVNARTRKDESALVWVSRRLERGPGYREVAQLLQENGAEL